MLIWFDPTWANEAHISEDEKREILCSYQKSWLIPDLNTMLTVTIFQSRVAVRHIIRSTTFQVMILLIGFWFCIWLVELLDKAIKTNKHTNKNKDWHYHKSDVIVYFADKLYQSSSYTYHLPHLLMFSHSNRTLILRLRGWLS